MGEQIAREDLYDLMMDQISAAIVAGDRLKGVS